VLLLSFYRVCWNCHFTGCVRPLTITLLMARCHRKSCYFVHSCILLVQVFNSIHRKCAAIGPETVVSITTAQLRRNSIALSSSLAGSRAGSRASLRPASELDSVMEFGFSKQNHCRWPNLPSRWTYHHLYQSPGQCHFSSVAVDFSSESN